MNMRSSTSTHQHNAHDGASGLRRTVDRRRLALGAAWAAPVILASSVAPAMAASRGNVAITSTCVTNAGGWATSQPRFFVAVDEVPVQKGSTFTLTRTGLALGWPDLGGTFLDYVSFTKPSSTTGTITFTVTRDMPVGNYTLTLTHKFAYEGVGVYRLSTTVIEGNANRISSDNSSSKSQSGHIPLPSVCI